MSDKELPVLYFDGVCKLCNASVQFVIRRDKQQQFRFASLQSAAGAAIIHQYKAQYHTLPDSIILQQGGRLYTKSGAALRTLQLLGGVYKLAAIGFIFPRFIRDGVYNLIAGNRYKWFGKTDSCMVPSPDVQSRFLD
ncbi:hypothetical protein CAP35_11075 [Chitinophagaceae bacterium IBVUCB1]|nr:hypothetical protein CAP35_11075 [Chitinophagaceae bacterium IBVUCB1]